MPGRYKAFAPVLFNFGKFNINDVPRYRIFYEDHFAFHTGQGSPFCGIILYQDVGKCNIFIFSSHRAKVGNGNL